MEIIFERFPLIRQRVIKNLDNQSLTRSFEAKRGFAEFSNIDRFFWIRIIKKYVRNFEGVEDSWREILHRTKIDVIKQLALAVEEFFKCCYLFRFVSPLQIAAEKGTLQLFQYVTSKVTDKSLLGCRDALEKDPSERGKTIFFKYLLIFASNGQTILWVSEHINQGLL